MANTTIEIKFSQTPSAVPSSLANGEISINTADGKIFYKDPSGAIFAFHRFIGPAGLDGELQFNDGGVLGATSNVSIDKDTGNLSAQQIHTRSFIEFADGTKQYTANAGSGEGGTVDSLARATANAAFDKANAANVLAQAAFDAAYTGNNFLGLADTPNSYSGNTGKFVVVNSTEDGLAFTDQIQLDEFIHTARIAPTSVSNDTISVYLTATGTSPNRELSYKIKNELGDEIILASYLV